MRAGLALFLMASLNAYAGTFVDKTDRFTGSRSVEWSSVPSTAGDFAMSAFAFYPKGATKPLMYKLSLLTWGESWQFLDCHHSNWLLDGQPAPQLNFEYKHEMAGSATSERFELRPNRAVLEKISSSKLVEYSLCGKEGRVSESDLAGIQRLLEATQ
jgi:hypothetical protein